MDKLSKSAEILSGGAPNYSANRIFGQKSAEYRIFGRMVMRTLKTYLSIKILFTFFQSFIHLIQVTSIEFLKIAVKKQEFFTRFLAADGCAFARKLPHTLRKVSPRIRLMMEAWRCC